MKLDPEKIKKDFGFDAVGFVKHKNKKYIIVGLETGADRNLDEFIGGDVQLKNWCFTGFMRFFSPKVDDLLIWLERIDPDVKPIAGYDDAVKLKKIAVMSGIGIQGRNTLIINPERQSRLRFRAVETSLDIYATGEGVYRRLRNHLCDECRFCEIACPVDALKDYNLINKETCLAHIQLTNRTPYLLRCNLCWEACNKDLRWAKQKKRERKKIIKEMLP